MDDGPYEEFDPEFEFLDVGNRKLGYKGILEVLKDLAGDQVLKQVRFNYNIAPEEFRDPKPIEEFIRLLKKILVKHKSTLVAIDLAGNHLFDRHPHPTNEHTKNYQETLCVALLSSKITHLDLSDNNITGDRGRELFGLTYLMKNFMVKGKAFKCRQNKITSQGVWAISNCLGAFSSLTFLDISYNMAGLDPLGRQNSEGIAALAMALKVSLHMRVLKIADNFLVDDDFVHIGDALSYMPQFQDLDVASNQCRTNGARALKLAIISHSIFADDRYNCCCYLPQCINRCSGCICVCLCASVCLQVPICPFASPGLSYLVSAACWAKSSTFAPAVAIATVGALALHCLPAPPSLPI
jgi:Ran GTPase-activating protein (RanGAP) involved in mRNA processing and transport